MTIVRSILLVDDDEDDRIIFQEALKDLQLDILLSIAQNGEEAITLLRERFNKLPNIVFLDLNMPLLSGRECLKLIRSDEKLKALKVIVYSTSRARNTIEALYHEGADFYLCKPADYGTLKKTLATAIDLATKKGSERPDKSEFIIWS